MIYPDIPPAIIQLPLLPLYSPPGTSVTPLLTNSGAAVGMLASGLFMLSVPMVSVPSDLRPAVNLLLSVTKEEAACQKTYTYGLLWPPSQMITLMSSWAPPLQYHQQSS